MSKSELEEYVFHDPHPTWGSQYIWPVVQEVVREHRLAGRQAFELGCGNGAGANMLSGVGLEVTAVDASESGISLAKAAFPKCRFELGSGYDDLAARFGRFELVMSLEVIQHCANPKKVARTLFDLVEPGGIAIVSATYHSYLKFLVLALAGKLESHLSPLWDTGPLKFFSVPSFRALLQGAGFAQVYIHLAGRMPPLAKSMVAVAQRPARSG
jgi:2-polyprenyl-6-hydroxyphenyl methylase/3-demethylubiquinone-9 3-methyltransferase